MNSNNSLQVGLSPRGAMSSIRSMAAVIALGVCGAIGSAAVHAQATSGSLFGWAPVGDTVSVKSANTGTHHQVTTNAKGRFSFNTLPMDTYTVTFEKDGQPVQIHPNVPVVVGRGQEVDYLCDGVKCADTVGR
jgi:Carboxypeptidase regulatory-like domain